MAFFLVDEGFGGLTGRSSQRLRVFCKKKRAKKAQDDSCRYAK
jgi:hypothetical protein